MLLYFIVNFASIFLLAELIYYERSPGHSLGLAVFNPQYWMKDHNFNLIGSIIFVIILGAVWFPYAFNYSHGILKRKEINNYDETFPYYYSSDGY